MKVLDLQCQNQHLFEGWFGSEADYQDQQAAQQIVCPLCASTRITRMLSAPRLNFGAQPSPPQSGLQHAQSDKTLPVPEDQASLAALPPQALQAAWLQMARKIMAQTEDVGERFAQEARDMHYGQIPQRSIRGHASMQEAQALLEEGVAVLPLPLPEALKETLQ